MLAAIHTHYTILTILHHTTIRTCAAYQVFVEHASHREKHFVVIFLLKQPQLVFRERLAHTHREIYENA
jgi:hypothetical protein